MKNRKDIADFIINTVNRPALPVYDCGDGAFSLVFESAEKRDHTLLTDALIGSGCFVYQTTSVAQCEYVTLYNGETQIQLSWIPCDGRLQAVVDPYTSPFPTEDDASGEIQTEYYQFETDHSLIDCGMCHMLRLCDGSFFLIDSGHFLAMNDHHRLFRFMRERTPAGGKVRIAGWFFTHGHDDHVCVAKNFLAEYGDRAEIERFYINLIPENHRDCAEWSASVRDITAHFRDTINKSGIPVVKLHTGQRFRVRNASFTVLCTHEDVYPLSCADYNESSAVLMCDVEGQRILIPGDACENESNILEQRYGKSLKCDIMQIAHHGHFGLSENVYRLCAPEVALFPNTYIFYLQDLEKYAANRAIEATAKEIYVSSDGTVGLPLPYSTGNAEVFPDETFEDFDGIQALWGYEYTDEFKKALKERFDKRR